MPRKVWEMPEETARYVARDLSRGVHYWSRAMEDALAEGDVDRARECREYARRYRRVLNEYVRRYGLTLVR